MYSRTFNKTSYKIFGISLFIALITFVVYLPALQNGFVNFDDNLYVYENENIRSIDLKFLKWTLTAVIAALWHPLTVFSLALDYSVWGLNPFGYHLTNILLHTFNTFLVFILAIQLMGHSRIRNRFEGKNLVTGALIALLFGIHPLHVESVAWVSERKDVLCAFFFLLSLLAYLKYASSADFKRYIFYSACLIFFIMALMSKPMAVSLPLVLLILDFYPLGRLNNLKMVLIEKLPFFMFSLLLSFITIWAHHSTGALKALETYPLMLRISASLHAFVFYLVKMTLPFNLAPYYPYPVKIYPFMFGYASIFIILSIITFFSIRFLKKGRFFSAVWIYYIVTLIPIIGIVKVGSQGAADRYTYLPSLGPFFLIGLAIGTIFGKCSKKLHHKIIITILIMISGTMANMTIRQIAVWHDPITLWSHVIKLFPGSASVAYYNRGVAYNASGSYRQAIEDYNKAIIIDSKFAAFYVNRGNAYSSLGNYKEAISDFSKAIELKPGYAISYFNRGNVNRMLKNYQEAIKDYDMAIKYNQRFTMAYLNRGNAYSELENYKQAIEDYNRVIELNPKDSIAYKNRKTALLKLGKHQNK